MPPDVDRPPTPEPAPGRVGLRPVVWGAVAAAVLAAAAFHLLGLCGSHVMFGDAYHLLLHAENLVAGRPYSATGYVHNPDRYLAPVAYPPGAPLLFAAAFALVGPGLAVLQATLALVLVAALACTVVLFRPRLSPGELVALALAVGLQPYLWGFVHVANSDLPFLLAVLAALVLYERAGGRGGRAAAVLCGLAVAAAVATRALGVVLPAAFLLRDLVAHRRPTAAFYVATAVALLGYGALEVAVDPSAGARVAVSADDVGELTGGYTQIVRGDLLREAPEIPRRVVARVADYGRYGFVFWDLPGMGPWGRIAKHLLTALALALVGLGYVRQARRSFGVPEAFALTYALALLPWSFGASRYFVPLVPFFYVYLIGGLSWLRSRAPRLGRRAAVAAVAVTAVVFAVRYADAYRTRADAEDPDRPLYRVLREQTPRGAVVVTTGWDPRIVAYYARRPAAIGPKAPSEWLAFARRAGASYLLVNGGQREDGRRLAAESGRLDLVASDDRDDLYRVPPLPGDAPGRPGP